MKHQFETTNTVPGSDASDLSENGKIVSSFKNFFQRDHVFLIWNAAYSFI